MHKTLTRAGLAALALTGAAFLFTVPGFAEGAAPAATPPAPPPPNFNKGDAAWMLTSTVLVLLMTIPGLALFYAGLVRPKNALSVLTHVFYTVCIVMLIWVIYGYSLAFTGGTSIIGGFDKLFLKGVTGRIAGGHVLGRRPDLRDHLHLLPDDVRGHHAGADRRRLRGAHEVLRGGVVHSAVGDLRLLPDRAHGLVLGRPGCDRRSRQGAGCCDRRQQGGVAGEARRGQCRLRTGLLLGRHRLRGRHRRAHQCRHRRPGRRDHGRPSHRLRQGTDASPLAGHDHDRRIAALGRLVRLQRGLRA